MFMSIIGLFNKSNIIILGYLACAFVIFVLYERYENVKLKYVERELEIEKAQEEANRITLINNELMQRLASDSEITSLKNKIERQSTLLDDLHNEKEKIVFIENKLLKNEIVVLRTDEKIGDMLWDFYYFYLYCF